MFFENYKYSRSKELGSFSTFPAAYYYDYYIYIYIII